MNMKPQFEEFRQPISTGYKMTLIPLVPELAAKIEALARAEKDTWGGLIIEGLARVLQDREADQAQAVIAVQPGL